jgi:predicted MFS family arabinose efflux permease
MEGNDEKAKNQKAFYAMTFIAFGIMSGSFIHGYIMDKRGHHACLALIFVVAILELSLCIIYNERYTFDWTAFLLAYGWGFYDSCLINFINNVLGFEFESKITPFAAQKSV